MCTQVFDQFVKTRAEEERKERKNKLMQAKEDFRKMMEDARLNVRCVRDLCFVSLLPHHTFREARFLYSHLTGQVDKQL